MKKPNKQLEHEKRLFEKIMRDLDLDKNGSIQKDEFIEAFAKKHQSLVIEKAELEEEKKDLEMKYDMILEREIRQRGGYYTFSGKGDITNIYKITVVEARELKASDAMTGTSDPYVVLAYQGEACKTTVKKTNLHPIWKETFEFHKKPGASNLLEVNVYDEDQFMQDSIIGLTTVDLEKYPSNGIVYDVWKDIVDEDKHKAGSIKFCIQHITHGIHAFEKERDVINEQMTINELKLTNAEHMLEMFEDNFAVFDIENSEQRMRDDVVKSKYKKSNNALTKQIDKVTAKLKWIWWLQLFLGIYIFLILLSCIYRPCFWDLFNA